jgi:hypothetical protein
MHRTKKFSFSFPHSGQISTSSLPSIRVYSAKLPFSTPVLGVARKVELGK